MEKGIGAGLVANLLLRIHLGRLRARYFEEQCGLEVQARKENRIVQGRYRFSVSTHLLVI